MRFLDNNTRRNKINTRHHIILPGLLPALFFVITATPVQVLGCRTRGLIALIVGLISGLASLITVLIAVKGRLSGEASSFWWVVSSLILVIPVIAVIFLA